MGGGMTLARAEQVDPSVTPYYHCITRCVRRAYLCGHDSVTGQDFSHRKSWVVDKLRELSEAFFIDICAFAVMSNHMHLVLRINGDAAQGASDSDVQERYRSLFASANAGEEVAETKRPDPARVELFRERLSSLSWFMRCLNEAIARRANREDGCRGRFWEGRFRSQALLDEAAVLTCMSYVDLNPVRAGIAEGLDDSDFTSIQQRLAAAARVADMSDVPDVPEASADATTATNLREETHKPKRIEGAQCVSAVPLTPMADDEDDTAALPSTLDNYVALLRYTGQAVRDDKRGALPPQHVAGFLDTFGINTTKWVETVADYHRHFFTMEIGRAHV